MSKKIILNVYAGSTFLASEFLETSSYDTSDVLEDVIYHLKDEMNIDNAIIEYMNSKLEIKDEHDDNNNILVRVTDSIA